MMTKFYLAARFDRHPEMREIRDRLVAMGHQVTSTWIDHYLDEGATMEALNDRPPRDDVLELARRCLADVLAADVVVLFTEGGGGRGGRHTEFGIGLGAGKSRIIVGPRENIFHALAGRFDTVEEWLAAQPHI
jgi:hypothetical protein